MKLCNWTNVSRILSSPAVVIETSNFDRTSTRYRREVAWKVREIFQRIFLEFSSRSILIEKFPPNLTESEENRDLYSPVSSQLWRESRYKCRDVVGECFQGKSNVSSNIGSSNMQEVADASKRSYQLFTSGVNLIMLFCRSWKMCRKIHFSRV